MPARMAGRTFFGRRLRIAREEQVPKMSRRELGERLRLSGSAIAAWESGRNIPDPETLSRIERILSTNGLLKDIAECLITGEKPQEYTAKWVNVEGRAATLPRFTYDLIPGLLQTEDYARAILRDDEQVKARILRQKILTREDPPVVIAIIDESVLLRNVGGPAAMRAQLAHLTEMAQHDNITIQVIRLRSPVSAQFTGPFSLASYHDEPEIGFVDDAISGGVVQNAEEVARLRRSFELFRKYALSEEESIRLIREVEKTWTD